MNSNKGTFIISIDFEYAIGYADEKLSQERQELIKKEAEISRKLITLFERYKTPATWAIVGHLLETNCRVEEGRVHSNFPKQVYVDGNSDWFAHHPPAGDYADPLWFDSSRIIKQVKNSPVGHEIASHSYSHILYGEPRIRTEAVLVDIGEAMRIHKENDLPLNSFIFPRNSEGYHEELKQAGIKCYRGKSRFWYHRLPGSIGRLARLFDYLIPYTRTVVATYHESGLVNIPDCLLLLGRNGLRKLVTPSVMKRKIKAGLRQAVKRKEIFHLWFHPSNFSYDTVIQFEIMEEVLIFADELRSKGKLEIVTMQVVADKI